MAVEHTKQANTLQQKVQRQFKSPKSSLQLIDFDIGSVCLIK